MSMLFSAADADRHGAASGPAASVADEPSAPLAADTSLRDIVPGFPAAVSIALALGAVFVWTNLDRLPVNFQIDGQVPEYLVWATTPEAIGPSLNPELNRHLYSFYYLGLGRLARLMSIMDLLRLVYALEILAVCAAVYFFAVVLTKDRWAALLAVAVTVWHDATAVAIGGSGGIGLISGPLYPATALALVALGLSWRRRHVLAACLAGLSFNLHGSSALFVLLMVLIAAGIDARQRRLWSPAVFAGLAALLAAAPTVVWILLDPPPAATMSTADWLRFPRWIYPFHMLVSSTSTRCWTMLFVFVLPGILGLASRRHILRNHMVTLQGWIVASGILLAVGYVFVEWFPLRPIAQLTLWRGTRYLVLLCLAFGLSYLVSCIRSGGFPALAAALTLVAFVTPAQPELAWIGHLGLIGLLAVTARRVRWFDRLLALGALLTVCGLVLYEASFLPGLGEYLQWRWPVAVLGLAVLFYWAGRAQSWFRYLAALGAMVTVALWLTEIGVSRHFPGRYRERAAALLALAPSIERACPPGQIIIAPPDLRNPGAWAKRTSFLCRQQLTAYAYAPWLSEAILGRMQWYVDTPIDRFPTDQSILPPLCEGYRTRTSEAFADLRDQYGVRLAVTEHDHSLDFVTVARNDLFKVYDFDRPLQ
jgi:hypothetical protein